MKTWIASTCLAALCALPAAAAGVDVKSGLDMGFKGAEEARYNALVKDYAGQDCRSLKKVYAKADKQASRKVGGGDLGGILKQVGGKSVGAGLGVVKDGNKQVAADAKIRRSAAKEVMAAKNCR
ncbi:MAG: hypothetical protein V2I43_28530 [Parvularcula sp.]|jgi:hypothetical protein|nr:hypothetical protein [Parvularcula sp.]